MVPISAEARRCRAWNPNPVFEMTFHNGGSTKIKPGFKQLNGSFRYQPVSGRIGVKTVIQKIFADGAAGLIAKEVVEIQAGNIIFIRRSD